MFQVIRETTINHDTPFVIISEPKSKPEAIETAIIYADTIYKDLIAVTTRIIVTPKMWRQQKCTQQRQ